MYYIGKRSVSKWPTHCKLYNSITDPHFPASQYQVTGKLLNVNLWYKFITTVCNDS